MISRTLLLLAVVGTACAAVWQGYVPEKPKEFADKEGCYVKEINDVIPYGSSVSPIGFCYSIDCDRRIMYYASCGVVGTDDPDCYITENPNKPYPDCCPDVKCIQENQL